MHYNRINVIIITFVGRDNREPTPDYDLDPSPVDKRKLTRRASDTSAKQVNQICKIDGFLCR